MSEKEKVVKMEQKAQEIKILENNVRKEQSYDFEEYRDIVPVTPVQN